MEEGHQHGERRTGNDRRQNGENKYLDKVERRQKTRRTEDRKKIYSLYRRRKIKHTIRLLLVIIAICVIGGLVITGITGGLPRFIKKLMGLNIESTINKPAPALTE